jgi:hypothetical protein
MRRALWIASGVIVWALHFTAVYGFTALACARGFPRAVPWAIGAATLAAAAVAIAIIAMAYSKRRDFADGIAAGVAAFALLAIVWEALPVLIVPACE